MTITKTVTLTKTVTPTRTTPPTPTPIGGLTQSIIDYTYDPLQRLTAADYSTGDYYHYTYDAVGNRLGQDASVLGLPSTVEYTYDDANRLETVDAVTYTYDANGNLLDDGLNTYTYDPANRLKTVNTTDVIYAYNGLGDRLRSAVNGQPTTTFAMDYNTGLTQVLDDGTNTYLYGNSRLAQINTTTQYFLDDALGSVRQMVNTGGSLTLARSYDPYGVVRSSAQLGPHTAYGFLTGEYTESTGMVYLRARHYAPNQGRFISHDIWAGDANMPMSYNFWNYTYANPINYTDPTGYITQGEAYEANQIVQELRADQINIVVDWGGVPAVLSGIPIDPMIIQPNCPWNPGLWTLDGLRSVKNAVGIMKIGISKLGGSFSTLKGSVTLSRVVKDDPRAQAFPGGKIEFYTDWSNELQRWRKSQTVIHELGHAITFNNLPTMKYFMDQIGSYCVRFDGEPISKQSGQDFCNVRVPGTGFYVPGPLNDSSWQNQMPSNYARDGNWEDYAETFVVVAVEAYHKSGNSTFSTDSEAIYHNPDYNHNIGKRRLAMTSILNGTWWQKKTWR